MGDQTLAVISTTQYTSTIMEPNIDHPEEDEYKQEVDAPNEGALRAALNELEIALAAFIRMARAFANRFGDDFDIDQLENNIQRITEEYLSMSYTLAGGLG